MSTDLTLLGPVSLDAAADEVCAAGVPGVFAEVRTAADCWRGASGVADVDTGEPVTPDMSHRVGSVSKTFVAAAVLQLVDDGDIDLDASIARYLPGLLPDSRGDAVTVRTLLNHTSGLAEYLPTAYPSLAAFPVVAETSPRSLEENRRTVFDPLDLITMGVRASASTPPGQTPGR